MTPDYMQFLESKAVKAPRRGLPAVPPLADHLYPFQAMAVEFALHVGSGGCFLDTGLGKTEVQLEFCQKAIEAINKPAILWTPLAVAGQTKRRAERWGYEAKVIREQSEAKPGIINICNYDRRDKIDATAFPIVSCDEASIFKSFTGATTREMTEAHRGARFKLVATATPAPNDHMELGNYADFLEIMAGNEMLSRFFINDTSTASQEWRLKGHAESAFWDWMASWARMAEKPSDLTGNLDDDAAYQLPPFDVIRHQANDGSADRDFASMFGGGAISAANMFEVKRRTAKMRAEIAVEIVQRGVDEWLNGQRKRESKKTASTQCEGTVTPQADTIANWPENHTPSARPSHLKRQTNNSDTPSVSSGATIAQSSILKMDDAQSVGQLSQKGMENSTSTTVMRRDASGDCSATTAISLSGTSKTTQRTFVEQPTISTVERMPAWVLWCDTNEEQNILERALGDLCISITGSQSADQKEDLHEAWLRGARPVLLTKPSMFGYGCDWQHCSNMIFVGRTFSYETWYQAVRRCWRFGQKQTVKVHLIFAEGEGEIGRVIDRKAADHAKMKAAMRDAMRRAAHSATIRRIPYNPIQTTETPAWLRSVA